MRIETRDGFIDTERTVRHVEPDLVIIDEVFYYPDRFGHPPQPPERAQAQVAVQRQLYHDNPAIADPQLRRSIEQFVAERDAQVPAQGGFVDRPRLGALLREPTPTDPRPYEFFATVPPGFTWTRTNATAVTLSPGEWVYRPDQNREARVEPVKTPERDLTCSCGQPDDPNWEHTHDECTFLDRPSTEWYDEGPA